MNTILVQISEYSWTIQAMHLACAMARSNQANLILLRLDHVKHPSYLGTEFGSNPPTNQELKLSAACVEIAIQYGVTLCLESIQCATTDGALVTAADDFFADALFAPIQATHTISFWLKLKTWNLARRLSALDCQLFTLDKAAQSPDQPPSIEITHFHIPSTK